MNHMQAERATGAQTRRRVRMTLTGSAMQAVAADLPPMGPGLGKKLIKRGVSLEIAGNYVGQAFFTLRGADGEVLADVTLAPEDFRSQESSHKTCNCLKHPPGAAIH